MPGNGDETATVSVEIPVPSQTEETVETPDQVTVITPPVDSGPDSTTVAEMLEQRERLVRAELRNEELERQIAEMQASVAVAQVTAEVAANTVTDIQEQVEELAEGEPVSPELDVEPTREHPFWRHV